MLPDSIKFQGISDVLSYAVEREGFGGIVRGVRASVIINIFSSPLENILK